MDEEYVRILTGDFLKNAGIVGLVQLLKTDEDAFLGDDYKILGNELLISKEYLKNANLTDLYFRCMVERYYEDTVLFKIHENIDDLKKRRLCVGDNVSDKDLVAVKEKMTFISEKLGSASYKTGMNLIAGKVENLQIYYDVIDKKFKNRIIDENLYKTIDALDDFLNQEIVHETLCFKSIIYTIINKFWEKSFLLRKNAKKDMKECYQVDFVDTIIRYLDEDKKKMKDNCIECSSEINSKNAISISFMNDYADDLSRKKSSLFHYLPVDVCPVCAFIYSLVPLGFVKYNNSYLFINDNTSIELLTDSNNPYGRLNKNEVAENKTLDNRYYKIYQFIHKNILDEQMKYYQSNVQVITREVVNDKQSYKFDILDNALLNQLSRKDVSTQLDYFAQASVIKINDGYLNLFNEIISRLLNKLNLYDLIYVLLKQSLSNNNESYLVSYSYRVLIIQYVKKGGNRMRDLEKANWDGYKLKKELSRMDNISSVKDKYRGTFYQMLNALRVNNLRMFIDITLRLYIATGLETPKTISNIANDTNGGIDIAYAFLAGLTGEIYTSKNKQEEENNG